MTCQYLVWSSVGLAIHFSFRRAEILWSSCIPAIGSGGDAENSLILFLSLVSCSFSHVAIFWLLYFCSMFFEFFGEVFGVY